MSLIAADHICVRFGTDEVLHDISLSVQPGEIVTILGPNGSGKSTLLRALLGIVPSAEGRITRQPGLKIGYVPQNVFRGDLNFPATVEEIVESGHLGARRVSLCQFRSGACDVVRQALDRTGIAHLMKKRIGELSGGERQRVFIARALVSDPALLVLDEPTTGIDAATEAQFYAFLEELNRSGMTIVLVSHDLEAIAREVKAVLCLNRRLVCSGDPSHLHSAKVLQAIYGPGKQMLHHEHRHQYPHH